MQGDGHVGSCVAARGDGLTKPAASFPMGPLSQRSRTYPLESQIWHLIKHTCQRNIALRGCHRPGRMTSPVLPSLGQALAGIVGSVGAIHHCGLLHHLPAHVAVLLAFAFTPALLPDILLRVKNAPLLRHRRAIQHRESFSRLCTSIAYDPLQSLFWLAFSLPEPLHEGLPRLMVFTPGNLPLQHIASAIRSEAECHQDHHCAASALLPLPVALLWLDLLLLMRACDLHAIPLDDGGTSVNDLAGAHVARGPMWLIRSLSGRNPILLSTFALQRA